MLKGHLFTPEGIALFRQEVSKLLAAKQKAKNPDSQKPKKRLDQVEKEMGNLMNAIKAGIVTKTTKMELQKLETEKAELIREIADRSEKLDNVPMLLPRIIDGYKDLVTNLETVTQPDVNRLRRKLDALLGDKIIIQPEGDKSQLSAELCGDYAGLAEVVGLPRIISLVAGARFELTTFRL